MEILVPRASQYLASPCCLLKGNLRAPIRQHRYYSIYCGIGGSTSHSECGLGQAGGIQITRSWPVRQPEGGYAAHGQGSRPTYAIVVTVTTSQQRILELEAELAKVKSENTQASPATTETPGTASTPIARALQGQPSASTSFGPSCLLVSPGSVNPWFVENQPSSLTETQYKKWLKDLKLPPHKQETL